MLRLILYIGAGSALGGILRYIVSRWMQSLAGGSVFPWGTLAVNLIGCLAIGLLYGLFDRTNTLSPETKAFLTVGLCGGFTTFSTFVHENYLMFESSNFPALAIYAGVSFAAGLLLAHAGHWIVKMI